MYASHFNWLQVSFRRTSLSSTGFESRKGERFPRAQGRRYLPVSASILLYFESLILNPTLRTRDLAIPNPTTSHRNDHFDVFSIMADSTKMVSVRASGIENSSTTLPV